MEQGRAARGLELEEDLAVAEEEEEWEDPAWVRREAVYALLWNQGGT